MPQERYEDTHPDRRDHCNDHGHQCGEITKIKTARNTERYMMGGIFVMAGIISSICIWLFKDNLESVRSDIKEIKVYIASGSINDASVKGQLDNLTYRIQRLEEKK